LTGIAASVILVRQSKSYYQTIKGDHMSNIYEKSLALCIETTKVGISKKVSKGSMMLRENLGEQPDESSVAVSKELISCKEFDSILKLDAAVRANILKLAVPSKFKKGIYLIPLACVDAVDRLIESYKSERLAMVESFVAVYKDAVIEAKFRLGGLFNIDDYINVEDVRDSFSVSSSYIDLGLPSNLSNISPEIFKREQEEFKIKMNSAADEIQQALRIAFKDLVDHMAERLTPDPEQSKPKVFRDSLIFNLREFMDSFNSRNITDDKELQDIINQAKGIIGNRSAEELRSMSSVRESVKNGLEEIKGKLNGMVTVAPIRKFNFND
jgi:hypothetical protein